MKSIFIFYQRAKTIYNYKNIHLFVLLTFLKLVKHQQTLKTIFCIFDMLSKVDFTDKIVIYIVKTKRTPTMKKQFFL